MENTDEHGALKKTTNIGILKKNSWNDILCKMNLVSKQRNLSEEFVIQVFKAIHQESINRQERVVR